MREEYPFANNVSTRDPEDGEAQERDAASFNASEDVESPWNEQDANRDANTIEDGMLLRDVPKRTTFYDPVAERQMTQTDAKLFYQRSKAESRTNTGSWSQATPFGSPMIASGSRPPTEYGADSLVLDSDGHQSGVQTPWKPVPDSRPETPAQSIDQHNHFESTMPKASHLPATSHASDTRPQGKAQHSAPHAGPSAIDPDLLGSGLFDTEPQITAELSAICRSIQRILDLRRKYIALSRQGPDDNPRDNPDWEIYPPPPEPAWKENRDTYAGYEFDGQSKPSDEKARQQRPDRKRKPGQDIGEDFDMEDLLPLPGDDGMMFTVDESGVYQVFEDKDNEQPAVKIPTIREFYMDLDDLLNTSSDGPTKSFAFRRLQYLEGKFNLYVLLNEYQETADSKKVPHRDFYNVRKVDTHVHHSACMNQKHLLRFIKSKMKKFPNEVVLYRDGKHLTLAEVFASISLTAYDLSIDTLDMHVRYWHLCNSFHFLDDVLLLTKTRPILIHFIDLTSSISSITQSASLVLEPSSSRQTISFMGAI